MWPTECIDITMAQRKLATLSFFLFLPSSLPFAPCCVLCERLWFCKKKNKMLFATYPQPWDKLEAPMADDSRFDIRSGLRLVHSHIGSKVASHLVRRIRVSILNHCYTFGGQMLSNWDHHLSGAPKTPENERKRSKHKQISLYAFEREKNETFDRQKN